MRICIFVAVIFLAISAVEVKAKRGKHEKHHKKYSSSNLSKFDGDIKDGENEMDKIKYDNNGQIIVEPPPVMNEKFHSKMGSRKMKEKSYKKKKHGHYRKNHKKTSWLDVKSDEDCDGGCKDGEICISGPIAENSMCVNKKDLKKSVKLFHRYQKKEKKSWRKFQKKNYKKDTKWLKKQEKMERKRSKFGSKRLNKDHYYENDKDFQKKYKFYEHSKKDSALTDLKEEKDFKDSMKQEYDFKDSMDKDNDFKDSMKELDFKESHEKKDYDPERKYDIEESVKRENNGPSKKPDFNNMDNLLEGGQDFYMERGECSADQFVQMRTRLMGWFHLLHGQDHLARKAHGGSIAKFYKHVSVKKELREHDGVKCGCLKSAMWEFKQLDEDDDDFISLPERAIIEENTQEPCLKPYLATCDKNGDSMLSSDEWCCCFAHVEAPCYKKVDEIMKSGDKDAIIPRCDKEGYYMREQCKGGADADFECWCVDINGNRLDGSDSKGRAYCGKIARKELRKRKTPFV